MYGKELILDIHNCQVDRFTRKMLKKFFKKLCKKIDMKRMKLCFWEYKDEQEWEKAPPHLKGISAVQFIETSNITIHALDDMKHVYLNIFSCKDFGTNKVIVFCHRYFKGDLAQVERVKRL